MAWKRVREFLDGELLGKVKEPDLVKEWLDSLAYSLDGKRLAACIAIDLISGSLETEFYAEVLAYLEKPFDNPSGSFAKALERFPDKGKLVACSAYNQAAVKDGPTYVRVMDLAVFIEYYVTPDYGMTLGDAAEVRHTFLQGTSLEDVKRPWQGGRGRVWLLPLEDFLAHHDPDGNRVATELNDILGLGIEAGLPGANLPELICVHYPENFDVCTCAQPTALDAQWKTSGYYVSYIRQDHWGRTQSCSGKRVSCRERIHGTLEGGLDERYSAHLIGTAGPIAHSRVSLVLQAYRRFRNCWRTEAHEA